MCPTLSCISYHSEESKIDSNSVLKKARFSDRSVLGEWEPLILAHPFFARRFMVLANWPRFSQKEKADGASISQKISFATALMMALAPFDQAMASSSMERFTTAEASSSVALERYSQIKRASTSSQSAPAPDAGDAFPVAIAAGAAGVVLLGGVAVLRKGKSEDAAEMTPAAAKAVAAPRILPRENAVLVLGATGRVGRRVVKKVRGSSDLYMNLWAEVHTCMHMAF